MKNYHYNKKHFIWTVIVVELVLAALLCGLLLFAVPSVAGLKIDKMDWWPVLLIGPLVSIVYLLYYFWKNRSLKLFSDLHLLESYMPPVSSRKTIFKFTLVRLAVCFVSLAMMNPQMGSKMAEGKTEGMDIMFCLDVSNSMLAEDLKPNRLKKAKRYVSEVINNLHGDRIGIVIFAGEAFVQLPITNDYGAARLFLNTVETDFVPTQGTAIGQALDLAYQGFDPESPSSKAIVVITDGENHEDNAIETAQYIADNDIKVYAIGMGTPRGGPIPERRRGTQVDYKKDTRGQVVISKLNPTLISELADAGEGKAFLGDGSEDIVNGLLDELSLLDKAELDQIVYSDYEDRFQWLLLPALLLLALDLLISEKKTEWIQALLK